MFKWSISAEAFVKAQPSDVWSIWIDVSAWPKWDHELEWSSLSGPFQVGTEGQLKPKGWPPSKFRLILVEEGKAHSDKTVMPMTEIIFNHSVAPVENGQVRIVHHVEVRGLLAPLLWFTMRRVLKKGLPKAVNTLAQLAEERSIRTAKADPSKLRV